MQKHWAVLSYTWAIANGCEAPPDFAEKTVSYGRGGQTVSICQDMQYIGRSQDRNPICALNCGGLGQQMFDIVGEVSWYTDVQEYGSRSVISDL
jgi:hypothetical protein